MFNFLQQQFRQPKGFLGKIISVAMRKMNNKIYDDLLRKMNIKDDDTIFEIGYGHGVGISKILAKNRCKVSGIDFSKTMHTLALKRNKLHIENGDANLVYGDFLDFELDPNSYDKIFCLNVVYFWNELEPPFAKIRNGLRDHGVFSFYMDHPSQLIQQGLSKEGIFNMYKIEEVLRHLQLAGFSQIDYQNENGYFVICKK